MRELTAEIKNKIRSEAITRLQEGNVLLVIPENHIASYVKILEEAWVKEEITFNWEIN